ncbi:outer membrane lipoprotein-sorting protein [Sulfurimonas diazotrophicus]|uniref:Outer membrane lipoprotein-sorting protein n=1 Tax=Sulfurimonas diazotrophicus TaxID=3131939 RepID=A0ABZ3HBN3_9BACT
MQWHRIATLLTWAGLSLCASESAEAIYAKSAKLFSFGNLRFDVTMTVENSGNRQERSFMVAERQTGDASSLLIRFRSPQNIKCTAILIEREQESSSNAIYFPALKRVRIIPEQEEESEAVGMGISYAELDAKTGTFDPLEETQFDGAACYKVTLRRKGNRSVYYIDAATSVIRKVEIFKGGQLQRVVSIDAVNRIDEQMLITRWQVNDLIKSRKLTYMVDTESVSRDIKRGLFHHNRLHRCTF